MAGRSRAALNHSFPPPRRYCSAFGGWSFYWTAPLNLGRIFRLEHRGHVAPDRVILFAAVLLSTVNPAGAVVGSGDPSRYRNAVHSIPLLYLPRHG